MKKKIVSFPRIPLLSGKGRQSDDPHVSYVSTWYTFWGRNMKYKNGADFPLGSAPTPFFLRKEVASLILKTE